MASLALGVGLFCGWRSARWRSAGVGCCLRCGPLVGGPLLYALAVAVGCWRRLAVALALAFVHVWRFRFRFLALSTTEALAPVGGPLPLLCLALDAFLLGACLALDCCSAGVGGPLLTVHRWSASARCVGVAPLASLPLALVA